MLPKVVTSNMLCVSKVKVKNASVVWKVVFKVKVLAGRQLEV